MKPEMLCPAVLLIAAVGVVAIRAANAETRSRKLGLAAVACGIAGFIPAIIGPMLKEPDQTTDRAVCGTLSILLAVAAVVLSIRTFRSRRREPGEPRHYPVIGLLCGFANLFCGAGLLVVGSGVLTPATGTPWTWRSDTHGFEVTIPSEHWTLKPNPNVLAEFTCSRPMLIAAVAEARPAGSDAEYEAVLAYGRRVRADTPTSNTDERTGLNRHGHPYWLYMGDAKSGDKLYFFGMSITRVGEKAVVMMFEGPYRMMSETGRAQEAHALRTQAELFLASVK